jgi:hypothetical protein
MIRLLAAGACVTLLLGVARMLSVPIAIATLGIAAFVTYRLARVLAGRGAARASAALLLASALPLLVELSTTAATPLSVLSRVSLLWWLPLVACAGLASPRARASLTAPLIWWAGLAGAALAWPGTVGTLASLAEVGPAALLGGMSAAWLAERGAEDRRRLWLAGALAVTSFWQMWLVLGAGRPARFLVPLLVAALLVATTDILTDDEPSRPEALGAALLVAIVVLGAVPGAHALVEHRHLLAAHAAEAEAPSTFEAP